MRPRRFIVAALVLLGLSLVVLEETLVHTDDGCLLETHCNACLLKLATRGVTTQPFTVPQGVAPLEFVAAVVPPAVPEETLRGLPSRGPPPA